MGAEPDNPAPEKVQVRGVVKLEHVGLIVTPRGPGLVTWAEWTGLC